MYMELETIGTSSQFSLYIATTEMYSEGIEVIHRMCIDE